MFHGRGRGTVGMRESVFVGVTSIAQGYITRAEQAGASGRMTLTLRDRHRRKGRIVSKGKGKIMARGFLELLKAIWKRSVIRGKLCSEKSVLWFRMSVRQAVARPGGTVWGGKKRIATAVSCGQVAKTILELTITWSTPAAGEGMST